MLSFFPMRHFLPCRVSSLVRRMALLCAVLAPLASALADPPPSPAVPPAIPTDATRRIMAGDRLDISVREQTDLNRTYAVAGDGTVDFSFAGRVFLAELTPDEAARRLESVLKARYFRDAHVEISIANFVEGDIYVTGAVQDPRSIPFRGDSIMTLVEAITQCGGLLPNAAGDKVRIIRWRPGGSLEKQVIEVDVQSMMNRLDFSKDQYLRPRDYIIVPTRGEVGQEEESNEFLAMGEVRNPGYHACPRDFDVIKAVTAVGGLAEYANWSRARILRRQPNGDYAVIPVDLNRLFSAADMSVNIPMRRGDIFIVPSVRNDVAAKLFLLGEVAKPGAVSFMPGPDATAARIILANGGLTEYADGRVQLQRTAPDGSKKSMTINVKKILSSGAFEEDVALQDGDVMVAPQAGILSGLLPL